MPNSNLARQTSPAPRLLDKPLTPTMIDALERTILNGHLRRWRVGYAVFPQAPFVPHGTIESLLDRGLLRWTAIGGGRVSPTAAGKAALAKHQAEPAAVAEFGAHR